MRRTCLPKAEQSFEWENYFVAKKIRQNYSERLLRRHEDLSRQKKISVASRNDGIIAHRVRHCEAHKGIIKHVKMINASRQSFEYEDYFEKGDCFVAMKIYQDKKRFQWLLAMTE